MIPHLGELALGAGVLASVWSLVACIGSWRLEPSVWLPRVRLALAATLAAFIVAFASLALLLARTDLRVEYVAAHTERALPLHLRLAALWSGNEGSLMLWALLGATVACTAARTRRAHHGAAEAVTLAAFASVNTFFASLLLFSADPFTLSPAIPSDGYGLHPQLQHWAMVVHPPILFTGYALFTVPFAIALSALCARRTDSEWVREMRPWALLAWLFLGAGISLGAYWAYVELGWGGYWAWDPAENASLMPWLTGTALVHTIAVHRRRGALKAWAPPLSIISFALCIFGTYLTRSGVVQSVHAFGHSTVGNHFLGALVVLIAAALWASWRGRTLLASGPGIDETLPLPRETVVRIGNTLLCIMALTTLIGTVSPILSELLTGASRSASQSFYNRLVAPAGLAAAALMALAPLLTHATSTRPPLRRTMLGPALAGAASVLISIAAGLRNPTALLCTAIAAFALSAVLLDLARAVVAYSRQHASGLIHSTLRVVDANHRRYGGHLAHLGMLLLILGVAGSSLFSISRTASLVPGDEITLGNAVITYEGLEDFATAGCTGVRASVSLRRPGATPVRVYPERRFYERASDTTSEVAIHTTWRDDIYIALVGWESATGAIALQVHINPLTFWIWTGAVVVILGASLTLMPRLLPRTTPRSALAPDVLFAPPHATTLHPGVHQ